ncbi:hypothetical protein HBE96_13090 [Clostridium sp. P21]|uniref:Uncharacterized protein n=1 Tax=Clostridium muellerianum TaxID=2716538 RepID=A0A7Y0EHR1_9CLOT|nr:hypothetical protein [Clostridium muellerianum]NMM63592.1 hypothetical protein [Clostridium muellerianum]
MYKSKQSKIGIISFFLAFIPIIYAVIQAILDFSTPIVSGFNKGAAISYFIMNLIFAISLVSLVLGIVALTRKGYKKGLPISAVIISGLILLIPLISSIKSITKVLNI